MVLAVAVSALFLVSYLVYHYQVGSVPSGASGRSGPSTSRSSFRTRCSRPGRRPSGRLHPDVGRPPPVQAACHDRESDFPSLAVCLDHRRGHLLDALSDGLPGLARRLKIWSENAMRRIQWLVPVVAFGLCSEPPVSPRPVPTARRRSLRTAGRRGGDGPGLQLEHLADDVDALHAPRDGRVLVARVKRGSIPEM